MKIPAQNCTNPLQEQVQNQSLSDLTSLEKIIDRNPLVVTPSVLLSEVIHLMSQRWGSSCQMSNSEINDRNLLASSSASCVLVASDNQLQGIFTERDLVRLISNHVKIEGVTVAEVMTKKVITLKQNDFEDVFKTIQLIRQHRIRHLPVVDENNSFIGLVTTTKLREIVQPSDLLRFRQVSEVMNEDIIYAPPTASMHHITRLMTEHKISCVVIVEELSDTPTNQATLNSPFPPVFPIGIVTERDIVQLQKLGINFATEAQTVMSKPLILVNPSDSLFKVNQLMRSRHVRRLVVAGFQGELKGIITQSQILKMLDPVEMYGVLELLQNKVNQLQAEKLELLQHQTLEMQQRAEIADKNFQQAQAQYNSVNTEKKELERQFYHAQRLESIATLASGVAHDLNNIFTPILASAQLLPLKLPDVDDETKYLIDLLQTNVRRGTALVKQILSFSRGVENNFVVFQVRHVLREIQQVIQETFPKSIQIQTDFSPELWAIYGDSTQIHQILMNLCINARDAMPNGGKLKISAENLAIDETYAQMHENAEPGNYIVITVSDTGVGIPPETLEHIFEPFFTTKEQGKGTGLGLSTVIGIVKNYGGFVNVDSDEEGTCFQIYLKSSQAVEISQENSSKMPRGNGELILVVDDEVLIRDVTKMCLEKSGYRVLTAIDGIDALAVYAQNMKEIPLILIDMMMPLMDGAKAIKNLKKLNPKIKTIMMSGSTSNNEKAIEDIPMEAFLHKPYTAEEMLTTVSNILNAFEE
ncbi:MAG: CBS domain-containing protein [Cyanobacteriota bacterium]|nr:CBS domain-containing protein [Cyanobacteriota bacterium]